MKKTEDLAPVSKINAEGAEYIITDAAVHMGLALGLRTAFGPMKKALRGMVHRAVPVRHKNGNMQFKDYILDFRSNKLMGIYTDDGRQQARCPACKGSCRTVNTKVRVDCDICLNHGFISL